MTLKKKTGNESKINEIRIASMNGREEGAKKEQGTFCSVHVSK